MSKADAPPQGTHNMMPVYDRNGNVYGWMCRRCDAGTTLPEDAAQMHGKTCYPREQIPWSGVALVILAVGAAVLAIASTIGVH